MSSTKSCMSSYRSLKPSRFLFDDLTVAQLAAQAEAPFLGRIFCPIEAVLPRRCTKAAVSDAGCALPEATASALIELQTAIEHVVRRHQPFLCPDVSMVCPGVEITIESGNY